MAMQRRLIPIVAFVAVLAALFGVRLLVDNTDQSATSEDALPSAVESRTGSDIAFTEVTEASGLATPHSSTELTGESAMTAGAAVADIDGDGDLDIYLTRVGEPNRLLLNDGLGEYTDATDAAGVEGNDPMQGSSAAAFSDIDGDGDMDLVVTGAGQNGTVLYVNDGDGRFVDGTAGSGLDDLPALGEGRLSQMHGLTFADFDRDGDLDLLMTHWDDVVPSAIANASPGDIQSDDDGGSTVCDRADYLRANGFPRAEDAPENRGRLYRNDGAGNFQDVSAELGLPFEEIMAFTGNFADLDGDGWDDLLITGDFCTSRVFRNIEGQRFEDITAAAGVGADENGMGSVVRDLNADGLPDWFITSIGAVGEDAEPVLQLGGFGSSGNRAYMNNGDGTFRDSTDQLGVRNGGWGWGAAIEDLANDGSLAFAMTNGYASGGESEVDDPAGSPSNDSLILWLPDGANSYLDDAEAAGLIDNGLGRALVPFDMDRDGDLDLLVTNFGSEPKLFRNDSPERHWITVGLLDPATPGNHQGVGAKVVITAGNGNTVTQWISTAGSYESQRPAEAHFGLGEMDSVERIEVTWPGETVPQVVQDVRADQLLVISRDPST